MMFSHHKSKDEILICKPIDGGLNKAQLASISCKLYANQFFYIQIRTYDPVLDIGWKIGAQMIFIGCFT